MQIIGLGMDATEIDRVAKMIEEYGDRFLHRCFTAGEIAYCQAKRDFASSFAARFAAKEAAMKALGTGHSRGVYWTGIEVVRVDVLGGGRDDAIDVLDEALGEVGDHQHAERAEVVSGGHAISVPARRDRGVP